MTRTARQGVAILTAILVVWTALWSLVSAAHARAAGEEVKLCHQAGSAVAPGEAPTKPGSDGKTHCPLCIMAFYGTAPAALAVPPLQFSTHFVALGTYEAPRPQGLAILLPPSRAPPALSRP